MTRASELNTRDAQSMENPCFTNFLHFFHSTHEKYILADSTDFFINIDMVNLTY